MRRTFAEPIRANHQLLVGKEDIPTQVWINDRYTVIVYDHPNGIIQLSIRRNDREYPRDWRHFQRIKNDICGPEREACELYPRESRLVDGANQFHLWVLPEGIDFPFGYNERRQVADPEYWIGKGLIGGRQRPIGEMS